MLSEFLCQAGFVNGNLLGSRSEIRSKSFFVEEWVFVSGESSDRQNVMNLLVLHSTDHSDCILETRTGFRNNSILFFGKSTRLHDKAYFGERIEAPLPPLRPRPICDFIHPRQLSPFLELLELPFPNNEILFGYEEIDSSGTDHFAAWVKMSEHEILVQHIVDIHKTTAEFREASERKLATSSHMNSSNEHFATRSVVQRRHSIYNWSPGPPR